MAIETAEDAASQLRQDEELHRLDVQSSVKGIARGGFTVFLGAIATILLNPLLRVFVGRALGPEGYGLVSAGLVAMTISTSVASMGLDVALARFIATDHVQNDSRQAWSLVVRSSLIVLGAGVTLAAALYVMAVPIAALYFHNPALGPVLRVFAMTVPFAALTQLFVGGFRGLQKMRLLVLVNNVLGDGGRIVLLVILRVAGLTVIRVSLLYLVSYILTGFISLIWLIRIVPRDRGVNRSRAGFSIHKLFSFATPMLLSQGLAQLLRQMDLLILGYFMASDKLGIYAAAIVIPRVISVGTSSLSVVVMPYVSLLFTEDKLASLKRVFGIVIRWAFYYSFPMLLLILLMPASVIRVAFGREYQSGAAALMVLTASIVLGLIPAALYGEALVAIDQTRTNFVAILTAVTVALVVDLALVPRYGLLGAAWGNLCGNLVHFGVEFLYLYRRYGLQPFGTSQLKYLCSCLIGVLVLFPLRNIEMQDTYQILLTLLVLYAMGILGLWLLKGVDDAEFAVVNAVARRANQWIRPQPT